MGEPSRLVLRVALRGEDLAAISALEVLRDELGARDLAALSRETVWEIALDGAATEARASARAADASAAPASARARLAEIARESLLFANPVKERWSLEEGALRVPDAPPGRRIVGLLVRDRLDRAGDACARALETDWELRAASVRRATLWLLDLPDEGREATAARASALGVTTRRDRGLLLNPHYQDVGILID